MTEQKAREIVSRLTLAEKWALYQLLKAQEKERAVHSHD